MPALMLIFTVRFGFELCTDVVALDGIGDFVGCSGIACVGG